MELKNTPLDNHQIVQLGFIVDDVEETKKSVAAFLGVEVPETRHSGVYETTKTVYRGEPATNAECYMAFFEFGNLQVEFIQPNEAPSAWREFLESNGEGLHHLAFQVQNMDDYIQRCEADGMTLVQRGQYREANGQYAFLDAQEKLKFYVELLESYEK